MKPSQHSRIIKMLKEAGKNGVENYRFARSGILCYSKRISELRREGHKIEGERQIINGRSTGVWKYYLVTDKKFKFFKKEGIL